MKKKAVIVISLALVSLVVLSGFFLFNKAKDAGETVQNIETVPLTPIERQAVVNTLIQTEFIKSFPQEIRLF